MPSPRLLALGVLVALSARPTASAAQSKPDFQGPAAVADSFFRATRDARWLDAARYMDLDAISAMRDQGVRLARRPRRATVLTAETFLEHDPKMPREVAEYQARQANERAAEYDPIPEEYARVPSVDSLARLSGAEVAARWLEARDERWAFRRGLLQYQKRGCISADSIDAMIGRMRPGVTRLVGTVVDDSVAFVLYERAFLEDDGPPAAKRGRPRRTRSPSPVMMPPSVMTLRRVDSTWRVVPSYESGGMSFMSDMNCPASGKRNDR